MLIGAHISSAHGLFNAPLNAKKQGCECYQFFSRPPQGGPAPKISLSNLKKFKDINKKFGYQNFYLHAPYFINLASENNRIYYGSISVLREELERGSLLGAQYLMTHLGSAKDMSATEALKKVAAGLKKILADYHGSTQFLIEMSAGTGKIIGNNFEEISTIMHYTKYIIQKNIAVCFDTAHAFESGYDLRDEKSIKKIFEQFDKILGLKKLKLIHANDSKTELGSHLDRHEHLGWGKIGLDGFRALINEPRLKKINLIIETPADGKRVDDLKTLKDLRDKN